MKKATIKLPKSSIPQTDEESFALTPCTESPVDSVGYLLKKAREKKKKEIQKIATQLRIRPRYLEALEQSRYTDFPGQAYALGFLRTYANFLGLDSELLSIKYREERSFIKPEKLEMPISEQQKLFPSPKYLLLGILVVALIWAFWYFLTYLPTEPAVPPIAVEDSTLLKTETSKENTSQQADGNLQVKTTIELENLQAKADATQKSSKSRIQIVAKDEVWIEIGQDDDLIVSRSLKKGEVYDVPADSENMLLKTGNAGAMDILVDGMKIKSLGPKGSVRSNISLSIEKLKNR